LVAIDRPAKRGEASVFGGVEELPEAWVSILRPREPDVANAG
jgi:hypothetical protein